MEGEGQVSKQRDEVASHGIEAASVEERAMERSFLGLQQEQQKRSIRGHRHDLRLMWLGIRLRICCNVSLRAVSQTLYAVGQMNEWCVGHISPSTVRNWCLRLGLYFLKKPLKPGRYVLIADESVAIGKERLLVLLAVRVDDHSPIRALQLGDVEVLHLQSSHSWGGQRIASIVKKKLQESGIQIAYGLSDRGSNLKNAFQLLEVKWVSDCTHEISNCAKKMLSKDGALNDLIKQMKLRGPSGCWAKTVLTCRPRCGSSAVSTKCLRYANGRKKYC